MKKYLKILLISICFLAVVPSCKKDGKNMITTEDPITKDAVTLAEARAEYSKALNQGLSENFLDKSLTPNWEKIYRYRLSENHNALYLTLYYKRQTGEVIQMIVMKDNGKVQSKVVQAIPNPSTLKDDKKIDYAHLDGRLIFFNSYGKLHGLLAVQNGKRLSSNLSVVNLQSSSLGDPDKDDDQDGVVNKDDKCPNTPAGDMVDGQGCSLDVPLDPVIITPDPGPGTGLPPIDTGGGYPPIGGDPGDGGAPGGLPGGGGGTPINLPNLDVSKLGAYPEFKKLVMDLPNFLAKYPNVLKALSYTTGFSEAQIKSLMQPGKGPVVEVVNDLKDRYGRTVQGQYDPVTNKLLINSPYVNGLDVVQSPIRYQAIGLMLTITTFHEFVHFGRNANNLPVLINANNGGGSEAGWYFEDAIQPGDIGRIGPENAVEWLNYYKFTP